MNTTTLAIERAMTDASRAAYAGVEFDPVVWGYSDNDHWTPTVERLGWIYRYSAANAAARKLVAERKATPIERTKQ